LTDQFIIQKLYMVHDSPCYMVIENECWNFYPGSTYTCLHGGDMMVVN